MAAESCRQDTVIPVHISIVLRMQGGATYRCRVVRLTDQIWIDTLRRPIKSSVVAVESLDEDFVDQKSRHDTLIITKERISQ